METIKLIVTHHGRLTDKYGAPGLQYIRTAVDTLVARDAERGVTTIYVPLDDTAEMEKYGAKALSGKPTAARCKTAIDALFRALSPDYLVLLGAGDVIPYFQVANPSFSGFAGDSDKEVPTDNPYACSQRFRASDRRSYLMPDRVVGRIPDLVGSSDPAWLLDYLEAVEGWKLGAPADFDEDFMVCCDTWKGSGAACVTYLSREQERLLISPPTTHDTEGVSKRYGTRLQMIKCHGAPLDARYFGQKGGEYPEVLFSDKLRGNTVQGSVVGAMCCYGASVFDPDDPAAAAPGFPPIPSMYLRQGAYGFFGSTTISWVGIDTMQCADWIIAAALRSVMTGASLGRALLESKQGLVQWVDQQGRVLDATEEKTLLQFHLLGDPSIHLVPPVQPATVATAALPGGMRDARATAAAMGPGNERRARRAHAHATADQLRKALPERRLVSAPAQLDATDGGAAVTAAVTAAVERDAHGRAGPAAALARLQEEAGLGLEGFTFGSPVVHEVVRHVASPELKTARMRTAAIAAAAPGRSASPVVTNETFEYYYVSRKPDVPVVDARLIKVETDREGTVIRTQVLSSS